MSTIRVDNFGPSAGGTTYSARGIAKAWVAFQGSGTAAILDSVNMSSMTDDGTGRYTFNYSNNFGNVNYNLTSATFENNDNNSTGSNRLLGVSRLSTTRSNLKNVAYVKTVCSYTGNDNPADTLEGYITFHGDLA